jgi:hypothetical protein
MTTRSDTTTRHHPTFRKDIYMQHIELRLADVLERQALYRSDREGDRLGHVSTRSVRRRLGESIIRLGRRVGGDTVTTPAWQG